MLCSEPPNDSSRAQDAPKFFRLPKLGERDPYFSLTKFTYLRLENAGAIKLTRVVIPPNDHGSVLVEYAQVEKYLDGLTLKEVD
jgi:hypothetical protein